MVAIGLTNFIFQTPQITKHWSNNDKLEMILEKLQYIAIAVVSPSFKTRWLTWWNSIAHMREALNFLPRGFTNKDLEPWLNKASFWVGISFFTFICRLDFLEMP
jgi:hypothetical protein